MRRNSVGLVGLDGWVAEQLPFAMLDRPVATFAIATGCAGTYGTRMTKLSVVLVAACGSTPPATTPDGPIAPGPVDISADLAPIAAANGMPALAALAADDVTILGEGVTGVRKLGDSTPVTTHDRWHLGSDTKAMTATLVAGAVEAGTLRWDMTIAQAFPEATIDAGYADVTIAELLAHVGAAPADFSPDVWQIMTGTGSSRALRLAAITAILAKPPGATRGTFTYSNAGYMIVGAALERATDTAWEDLLRARVFGPLGMTSCGFGPTATAGQVDQPWGHILVGSALQPMNIDNPQALGPAGTVHCSLADWTAFLRDHLRGALGESTVLGLKAETWTRLHTPPAGGDYAMGWIVASRQWAAGVTLAHVGSNTLNVADIWLAPGIRRIFVSAGNRGDDAAMTAADATIARLVTRFPVR